MINSDYLMRCFSIKEYLLFEYNKEEKMNEETGLNKDVSAQSTPILSF
jgi:hypothetical protein